MSTLVTIDSRSSRKANRDTRFTASTNRVRRAPRASICIPAHNEDQTIGDIVTRLRETVVASGLASEIIVIDDRSSDFTRIAAELAGAQVFSSGDILPTFGPSCGKGDAMWRSLAVSTGDVVLWCDGDLETFDVARLSLLLEALRDNPEAVLVKGSFTRLDDQGNPTGGRVTELAVRPLLSLVAPEAARIHEPLGGIYAMRRSVAERLRFESDYGVDVGLLLDAMYTYGPEAVLQVELGELTHRHQSAEALAVQSSSVQRAILCRTGFDSTELGGSLHRRGLQVANITAPVRPPLQSLSWYAQERVRLGVDADPRGDTSVRSLADHKQAKPGWTRGTRDEPSDFRTGVSVRQRPGSPARNYSEERLS